MVGTGSDPLSEFKALSIHYGKTAFRVVVGFRTYPDPHLGAKSIRILTWLSRLLSVFQKYSFFSIGKEKPRFGYKF
jgi:hypothetical protein